MNAPNATTSVATLLDGRLDLERLDKALTSTLARHDAGRAPGSDAAVIVEMRSLPADGDGCGGLVSEAARMWAERACGTPLLVVFRGSAEHHLLVLISCVDELDSWSADVLMRDIAAHYSGHPLPSISSPPEVPGLGSEQLGFEGAPTVSRIPWRSRPSNGGVVPVTVPASTWRPLRELAAAEGCGSAAALLALTQALVARCAAQDDVVVALGRSGRPHHELWERVGRFQWWLPVRGVFSPKLTFREHLGRIRPQLAVAPTVEPRNSTVCQVGLDFVGGTAHEFRFTGLRSRRLPVASVGGHELRFVLGLAPEGGLQGWLAHSDRYDSRGARAIAARFRTLAEMVVCAPDTPLDLVNVLPDDEMRRVLALGTGPVAPLDDACLPDLVLQQAIRTPDRVALVDADTTLTYAETVDRARRLAQGLRELGVKPDAVVGVCVERSVDLVVSLLGVLLAGGAYLPLDPQWPQRRLGHALQEAAVSVVVAEERYRELVGKAAAHPVTITGPRSEGSTTADAVPCLPDDLAYVIYTSGSTGSPKGVAVPHRGIVNRLRWMQEQYRLRSDDIVLQKTPCTFDVSVWEFFWPLMAGARLVLAAPDGHRDQQYLSRTIREHAVTTIHFVPSMLAVFLSEPSSAECRSLRRVICSGEALSPALVERFRSVLPATLDNLYGPTEASVDVTHWRCGGSEDRSTVPIGIPITNVTTHVLDRAGNPSPIGSPGELHIGGVALARGYIGRADLTADRFVESRWAGGGRLYRTGDLARWHPDGHLEYLGRTDRQVKLRGLRIELGEIEAVLASHRAVSEAAVAVRDDLGATCTLVGYFVASEPVGQAELKAHLRDHLPDYMVPFALVALEAMPQTPNGKLDHARLPKPVRGASSVVDSR